VAIDVGEIALHRSAWPDSLSTTLRVEGTETRSVTLLGCGSDAEDAVDFGEGAGRAAFEIR
jgi:hypothetical protein